MALLRRVGPLLRSYLQIKTHYSVKYLQNTENN